MLTADLNLESYSKLSYYFPSYGIFDNDNCLKLIQY